LSGDVVANLVQGDALMTDAGFAEHLKFLRGFRKERGYDPHGLREAQMQRGLREAQMQRRALGRLSTALEATWGWRGRVSDEGGAGQAAVEQAHPGGCARGEL
jgi:hypothetical protein